MKKILLVFMLATVVLYSCDDMLSVDEERVPPLTRAIVNEANASVSNPNLFDNWENVSEVVLNTIGTDVTDNSVYLPWIDGAGTSLSENFRKDIKKENGWKMLFHTFKKVGVGSKINYICLYNQFTGYLKVFYFYEGDNTSQGTQWFFKTSGGQSVRLLGEGEYLSKPADEAADNNTLYISNLAGNPTDGLEPGWNGFELLLPYSTDYSNMDFAIGAYNKRIASFDLNGKADFTSVGTVTTTSEETPETHNAIANLVGPEAKKLIDKLVSNANIGTTLSNLISKIPSKGYTSVIKEGLNMIFGKTTTTTVSDIKLTTAGQITLNGTISSETTAGIPSVSFDLYGASNGENSASPNTTNRSLVQSTTNSTGHYLGVWTLQSNPVVYYNRLTLVTNPRVTSMSVSDLETMEQGVEAEETSEVGEATSEMMVSSNVGVTGTTTLPQIQKVDYEVVFNPDIEPYITNKEWSINYVVCDTLDGKAWKTSKDVADLGAKSLLYKDDYRKFYEINRTYERVIPGESWMVDSSHANSIFLFDWGRVKNGRTLAVVSVSFTYTYQGVSKEVNQTRTYEVKYAEESVEYLPEFLLENPRAFIVNSSYYLPYLDAILYWP